MKKEDFKEATPKHIKIAKKILKHNGCFNRKIDINCDICPFSHSNNVEDEICKGSYNSVDKAKQFLELFDTDPKEKSLNFYERLSATLYNKQVLFKQDNGSYYNQRLNENMSKSEVKEWLLAEVAEVCKND